MFRIFLAIWLVVVAVEIGQIRDAVVNAGEKISQSVGTVGTQSGVSVLRCR